MELTSAEGVHREFTPEPAAVRAAREFVVRTLEATGCDLAKLELAASEIISNAVLHARTPFVVRVQRSSTTVRVTVSDGSTRLPRQRFVDRDSITGRGLPIVDRLATRWGAELDGTGKAVWFELECGHGA